MEIAGSLRLEASTENRTWNLDRAALSHFKSRDLNFIFFHEIRKLQRFLSLLCFGKVKSEAGTQPASHNRCKKNSDFVWSNMVTWCSKIKQEVESTDTETVTLLVKFQKKVGTCVSIGEKIFCPQTVSRILHTSLCIL